MNESARTPAPPSATEPGAAAAAILCPLCDYNLRGLVEPLCPECGYRFAWEELSDPERRFHPWLFEHHPEANRRTFLRTLAGGVPSRSFWSTLYPTQPSRPRRLVAYWVLCALPLAAATGALAWVHVSDVLGRFNPGSWGQRWVKRVLTQADMDRGGAILTSLACLLWPWLTHASLLVFQISLRRAKLRRTHVLRCVLYSGDVVAWYAVPVALVALLSWAGRGGAPAQLLSWMWPLVPLGLFAVLAYRLFHAYEFYLRFDHALSAVVASQVMVGLVYCKAWYVLLGY